MNRRTLLTIASMGAATVAGCIGSNSTAGKSNSPEYEECDLYRFIPYTSLPEDVRDEVEVALNDDRYENDGTLLWEQITGSRVEGLVQGRTYYSSQVTVDNGVHTLQFEETTPQYDSKKYLHVSNAPEGTLNITIIVKDTAGTILEKTELIIEEGHSDQRVPVASEFGKYMVEVSVEEWGSVTEPLRLGPSPDQMLLSIREDDDAEPPLSVSIQKKADKGADSSSCSWE